jgi:hypothetical protein
MLISFGTPIFDQLPSRTQRDRKSFTRWGFMPVASPIPVPRETGAPLNPMPIF